MLCRRALELKPTNPSYALNLMHGMELDQAYGKALQLALHFCQATKYVIGMLLLTQLHCPFSNVYCYTNLQGIARTSMD